MRTILFGILLLMASDCYAQQSFCPLTFTIKSDKLVYREGENLSLFLLIKNISKKEVSVNTWSFKYDDPYEIINSSGVNVYQRIAYKKRPITHEEDYVLLKPNEVKIFKLYIWLQNKLKPGTYRIRYNYECDGQYENFDPNVNSGTKDPSAYLGKIVTNLVNIRVVKN